MTMDLSRIFWQVRSIRALTVLSAAGGDAQTRRTKKGKPLAFRGIGPQFPSATLHTRSSLHKLFSQL